MRSARSTPARQLDPRNPHAPPPRFLTCTATFDGHDAAINMVRRLLQEAGAEVVHLGHNRRVEEIVAAAIQEDVDAVAISSYQGGHTEFFGYLVDALAERGGGHIRVFGGGGGTITSEEAEALEAGGVSRIYAPEHGKRLGLRGMIQDMLTRLPGLRPTAVLHADPDQPFSIARTLSHIERGGAAPAPRERSPCPVLGVTGTGGAGKSSVVDELLFRLLRAWPDRRFALLAIDPTRHRSGGALLGDRIRMNSVHGPRVYMRSMATRRKHRATNAALPECIAFLRHAGFDLVIVETAGTGQGDAEIAELVDLSLYVMTSDYGAPSQLEKIQMLDYADLVALNKSDKQGAEDALREVQRQLARGSPDAQVTATVASRHNDRGITGLCRQLSARLEKIDGRFDSIPAIDGEPTGGEALIPAGRVRYLGEISETGRRVRAHIDHQCAAATRAQHLYDSLREVGDSRLPEPLEHYAGDRTAERSDVTLDRLRRAYEEALGGLDSDSVSRLREWPTRRQGYRNAEYVYRSGGRELRGENFRQSLSRLAIPKLALPRVEAWGELLRFLLEENLPGAYPYTAGVFSYRRSGEDPTRMFAGEGTPERTNRRFHYLAAGQPAVRLSTAFDPVALYGEDPDARPDIYGRVGMSGVSVATLDDMKKLYSGFDLCAQNTSVSMTINGPAPIMLAWVLNVAVDQQVGKYLRETGKMASVQALRAERFRDQAPVEYYGDLPAGNDGLGLALLGLSGDELVDRQTYARIRSAALKVLRGTVQADILKEDQAQNECIFPLELGLRMMGDMQQTLIAAEARRYYSVSVSGYHIAEAGANPITQLAFTLANGFTLVEYYLARGMAIDDFVPQFSFFFSNGMDPEYAVIGRVARRIWARAMRNCYDASPRSQRLKYHIQTSGRSLQAQDIDFNDARTTLQALYAVYDNCNSLHTNAYDEAVTTPTEESVRRALAIQLIINRELGLTMNENVLQGSFIIQELTDLVEEAVYAEFDRLSLRGGVLGAMEHLYQRTRIQEESLDYEQQKESGAVTVVGVNTFVDESGSAVKKDQLIRASTKEKEQCLESLARFKAQHAAGRDAALRCLQDAVLGGVNIFDVLMKTVRHCSLGQITHAIYEVGGRYRRRM